MSFHWGWFLRYKLSAATASPPILGPPPPPRHRSTDRAPASPPASRTITQFARRPLRDIQHTHYHPQIVVVRVVSRCATGCREPHTYSADASPSTHVHPSPPPSSLPCSLLPSSPPRSTSTRTAPVIYCPGVPEDSRHAGRGRNFLRPLAKLKLRSSFRDRLMFRRFIKTEKRRGSREAGRLTNRPAIRVTFCRSTDRLPNLVSARPSRSLFRTPRSRRIDT